MTPTTETKTIPGYVLPLLVGQEYINTDVADDFIEGTISPATIRFYLSCVENTDKGLPGWNKNFCSSFRPLLRPSPADMTDEELLVCGRILFGKIDKVTRVKDLDPEEDFKVQYLRSGYTEPFTCVINSQFYFIIKGWDCFYPCWSHNLTAYLASLGLDVFGLIPQGLAKPKLPDK